MSSGSFLWNWAKHSGIYCALNAVWVEKESSLSCNGTFGNSLGSILKRELVVSVRPHAVHPSPPIFYKRDLKVRTGQKQNEGRKTDRFSAGMGVLLCKIKTS